MRVNIKKKIWKFKSAILNNEQESNQRINDFQLRTNNILRSMQNLAHLQNEVTDNNDMSFIQFDKYKRNAKM